MVHTLDASQALLTSTWAFPSRAAVKAPSLSHFANLARRLYRVLSHAWRHHPRRFAAFEAETRCAARFEALARQHSLLAEEAMVIRAGERAAPQPQLALAAGE